MPVEWKLEDNNLATVHVSGQLGKKEYEQIQASTVSAISTVGKIRILVLLVDFAGWEAVQGWGNISVTEKIDPYLEKMAIVGELKWKDLVEVFTLKGLRPVPIEYFAEDQIAAARAWLET